MSHPSVRAEIEAIRIARHQRTGTPGSSAPTAAGTCAVGPARKCFLKRAGDRQRGIVGQLVRARIAHESLDQLQQRRPSGWTGFHYPASILISQHREVLHCLHVSPAHQRLLREWNLDLLSRAPFRFEQGSTIVRQLPRASHRVRADRHCRDGGQPDQNESSGHFCLPNRTSVHGN